MARRRVDSRLDPLRNGLAVLRRDGAVSGYLATTVESFWGLGRPFGLQERVWLLVTWADGQRVWTLT